MDNNKLGVIMNIDQKWEIVEKSLKVIEEEGQALFDLARDLDISPESQLLRPFIALEVAMIETLSKVLDDEDGWLSWFVDETQFGETPLRVEYEDGSSILVDSFEQLRAAMQY